MTGWCDKTGAALARTCPIQGDPGRILLWTQAITGKELDEPGQVRVLDTATRQQRRQQLEKLGGPPQND